MNRRALNATKLLRLMAALTPTIVHSEKIHLCVDAKVVGMIPPKHIPQDYPLMPSLDDPAIGMSDDGAIFAMPNRDGRAIAHGILVRTLATIRFGKDLTMTAPEKGAQR